jgi:hypothetical protein
MAPAGLTSPAGASCARQPDAGITCANPASGSTRVDPDEARAAGANASLAKPFLPSRLCELVREVLAR